MSCCTTFIASECSCLGSFGPQWTNKGFEVASSWKQTNRNGSIGSACLYVGENALTCRRKVLSVVGRVRAKPPWGFVCSSSSGLFLPAAVLPAATLTSDLISLVILRWLSTNAQIPLKLSIGSVSKDACQFFCAKWCFIDFTLVFFSFIRNGWSFFLMKSSVLNSQIVTARKLCKATHSLLNEANIFAV